MRRRTTRRAGDRTRALAATLTALATLPAALAAQATVELPAGDRPVRLNLADVYAVGGAMADDWQIFGELSNAGSLAFDGAGNLYVFDRDNYRVAVVSPTGELVREFGKQGEGPGEWRMPLAMTVLRDGSVVITDIGHRAYLVYGSDGELQRTVAMSLEGGGFSFGRMQADPRGGAVYSSMSGGMRVSVAVDGAGGEDEPSGRVIEHLSLTDGESTDFFTAWEPPREDEGRPRELSAGNVSFRLGSGGPRRFEPALHVGVLPDGGLAVVDSTAWAVKVVGPDGSLERVLRRPSLRPRPVTESIEEQDKERRLAELEAGEGPQMRVMVQGRGGGASPLAQDQIRDMQRQQIEATGFYPEIPVVRQMSTGWNGTLWVQRNAEEWWEGGAVDLVTPEGRYVGTVSDADVPVAFGPDGLVAYLERDEFDVPTIRVHRLPEALR